MEGLDGLDLPRIDISRFHVAGFDIAARPENYEFGHNELQVHFMMHAPAVGSSEWITVDAGDLFPLMARGDDKARRDEAWKSFCATHIRKLILHELDESLFFDGKHYRDPHPANGWRK